jgi:hypothetical protein
MNAHLSPAWGLELNDASLQRRRLCRHQFDESWASGFAAMRQRDLTQAFLQTHVVQP